MKGPIRLLGAEDIPYLAEGFPEMAITRTTRTQTPEEFAKQSASIARRRTNASVVGIVLLQSERIALVKRTGSNAGWALPSGSLRPKNWWNRQESFQDGIRREMREELGVRLAPPSIALQELEERTFIHAETGAAQNVYVATFLAHAALGQQVHQTRTASHEGLTVATFGLDQIPQLAFNDNEKVARAITQAAV